MKKNRTHRVVERIAFVLQGPVVNKVALELTRRRSLPKDRLEGFFRGKRGLRIGGGLRDEFRELSEMASEIVDVNLVEDHHSQNTKTDFITDAADLGSVPSQEYDFVASSHVLEHLPNPIKALTEWRRVLRSDGVLYCGVPNRFTIFDHRRPVTSLQHLDADYRNETPPDDMSHADEFVAKWDYRLDSVWNDKRELCAAISQRGASAIHHHVWTRRSLERLLTHVGFSTLFSAVKGRTIHVVARPIDPRSSL